MDVLLFLSLPFLFIPIVFVLPGNCNTTAENTAEKYEGLQPLYDDGNRCRIAVLAIAVLYSITILYSNFDVPVIYSIFKPSFIYAVSIERITLI